MADKTRFDFTARLYWPHVYEPTSPPPALPRRPGEPPADPRYGFSIDVRETPDPVKAYLRNPRTAKPGYPVSMLYDDLNATTFYRLSSRFKFPVFFKEGNRNAAAEVAQLREFMLASNLPPDRLFDGIKARIVCTAVAFERIHPRGGRDSTDVILSVEAIQVSYTDMLHHYDRACERSFAPEE